MVLMLAVFCSLQLQAQTPIASFSPSVSSGCAPLQVTLSNASVNAISYQWNFGNGNSSSLVNPSTVYNAPGTYTITLIATSGSGLRDTTTSTITIVPDPVPDFSGVVNGTCAGNNHVQFTNLSTNAISYLWDFGDGNTSTQVNPSHTYTFSGTFNVKLLATSLYGCQELTTKNSFVTITPSAGSSFSASPTSTCSVSTPFSFTATGSNATTWNWNFGDGNTSNQQNPNHTYSSPGTYTITLITSNAQGCSDTVVKTNYITIGNSLVPSFTMSDSAGCGPVTIQFNSTVPNATSWTWNFGDGTTSTIPNPSHTYTIPGIYDITLAATTHSGCNGSVTYPGIITVDAAPVVNFIVSRDSGCAPYTPTFTFTGTGAATFNWTFGNSSTGTGNPVTATYNSAGNFHVSCQATSPNGCVSSLQKNAFVKVFQPAANFNAAPRTGCQGTTVQFTHTASSVNIVSWLWNFGDGGTSTLQNPSHAYNNVGNYNVTLIVRNSFGCIDTFYRGNYIRIVNGTVPYTVPDTIKICQMGSVSFIDPSLGSNAWNWNFGNGSTSTTQNPTTTFPTPGIYTISLTTQMPGGCSQSFSPFAIVQVIPYVPFPIVADINSICKPYGVTFSIATPDVINYTWDFGDGSPTSNLPSSTHYYTQAGVYTVTLTMTVGAGCIVSTSTTVTVGHANPIIASSTDACVNTSITFNCNNAPAFTSLNWDFANGSGASSISASTSYASPGNYTVNLYTIDTAGCRDTFPVNLLISNPIANFSVNPVHVCLGNSVQFNNGGLSSSAWSWDFGDTNTDTVYEPSHTYQQAGIYDVTLTAVENGCSVKQVITGAVHVEDPQVNFTATPNGQCMPVTVSYNSVAPTAVSWLWYFGDGSTSTAANPQHTFNTPPNGPVILVVTDPYGCTKIIDTTNIDYYAASASAGTTFGCGPLSVKFTDHSQQAVSWLWDFGDGTTSTSHNPTHIYTNDGLYTVTLIATFPNNCRDTVVYVDMITVNTPHADFMSPTVAGCSPTNITFVNQSNDASSFLWDFGDNSTSVTTNPDHIYSIPGVYTISLIATNAAGCTDTLVRQQYIRIPGTYTRFGLSALTSCQNAVVSFTDSSINASIWAWDFGDGSISNLQNPTHTYQDTGSYIMTLITQDSIGCTSSYTYPQTIFIQPQPVARGTTNALSGCNPLSLTFSNSSNGANGYEWLMGDGSNSLLDSLNYTYNLIGVYNPQLIATNQFGCKDTFDLPQITVNQTPVPGFSSDTIWGCIGSDIQFFNQSTFTSNAVWNWNFGFTNSTQQHPNIVFNTPGFYNVSLSVTNDNGCSADISQTSFIEILDTIPPAETPVYSVSVVNDNAIDITWENIPARDFERYSLYRYNQNTNQYSLIKTFARNQIPTTTDLTFRDTGLDTKNNTYTYKVLTTDLCGYEIPLLQLKSYTSINVTASTASSNLYVQWTPYIGCDNRGYEIYRKEEPSGSFQLIATVDSATLNYLDTTLYCPYLYSYRVKALSLCGRGYDAWSDSSSAQPGNPMEFQQVEMTRSTVINNSEVLTEWVPPVILPGRVKAYMILRGVDGGAASPYALEPAISTAYIDTKVDVNHHSYSYYVVPVNDCELQGVLSREGKSILLDGYWSDYQTYLNWTPYEKWPSGVQQYGIEQLQEDGSWKPVETTLGNVTKTVLED
jgi:PKD repeat protein